MDKHFIKDTLFSGALKERVQRIQNGDEESDTFIAEYKSFILSAARQYSFKNYITESDDEYSIALIAFAEAIKAYQGDKGNFLSFARKIIQMRCIDYYRKEKRHISNLPLDDINENTSENDLSHKMALDNYEKDKAAEARILEIEQFKSELAGWNISIADLVEASPKQAKTREMCKVIIRYLMSEEEKVKHIFKTQMLPLAEIHANTGIPRKQLERLRKYIIATLIIKKGDYQCLGEYVRGCM